MRNAVLGTIIGLGLLIALWVGGPSESQAQLRVPSAERGGVATEGLQVVSVETVEGRQQLVMMDPKAQVLAVYQIDRSTGSISLKSVRAIRYDLLLEHFGSESTKLKPGDIRTLVEEQKK